VLPFAQAQDTIQPSKLSQRKNEVRVNVLSLIAFSKMNLTYERYVGKKFSVGVTGNYVNSDKVNEDFDDGNRDNNPKYEVTPLHVTIFHREPKAFILPRSSRQPMVVISETKRPQ
jgi:hypothetical protein